ncbi:NgrC [Klebsiella michiganensis]|uniref:NgrC n=1 Tax=Klebsiella michiganensis TaxID=1134687 RepID=UPI0037DCE5F1
MNVFNNLFNRHCQNTLLAHGWPADLELDYSLRYCQGDGVAFYGVLHDKEILTLLSGLLRDNHITEKLAEEVAEVIKDSDTTLTLERNSFGYRYSHVNTIRAELENYPDDIGYEERFNDMLESVRGSIEQICSTLEGDGYKIHESITPSYEGDLVMSRSTANFEIIVTESEEEYWDTSDTWDDECKDLCIADILSGKCELKNLEIQVRGRHTGKVYGQHYAELVFINKNSPVRSWFDREWLRTALDDARGNIEENRSELKNIRS